jgi:hypothetical protein
LDDEIWWNADYYDGYQHPYPLPFPVRERRLRSFRTGFANRLEFLVLMTHLHFKNFKKSRIEKVQSTGNIYRKIEEIFTRCSAPSYYWTRKFGTPYERDRPRTNGTDADYYDGYGGL